ncbi:hypothetical protein GMORB2_1852, partial [Geosmithia morbida]
LIVHGFQDSEPSVASLSSSILEYQRENGRRYHALSRGKYVLPNDEDENNRLDLQHELYVRTMHGELALCPKAQGARNVLDMGTGTGQWAISYGMGTTPHFPTIPCMILGSSLVGSPVTVCNTDLEPAADLHPEAHVIGVDLSPIQPDFHDSISQPIASYGTRDDSRPAYADSVLSAAHLSVPPNLNFEIDDLEKEWTWSHKFDFIFARMMLGCFENLPAMMKVAYDNLEPGGYIEFQDMALPARSDDGTLDPNSYLSKWCDACLEAGQNLGRPVWPVVEYKNYLADAGFECIVEVQKKWPTNTWPRDSNFKELGMWAYANIAGSLEGLSLAYFARGLGWTPDEIRVFCAHTRKDLKDPKIHAYWPIYVVYGRKPFDA